MAAGGNAEANFIGMLQTPQTGAEIAPSAAADVRRNAGPVVSQETRELGRKGVAREKRKKEEREAQGGKRRERDARDEEKCMRNESFSCNTLFNGKDRSKMWCLRMHMQR